MANGTLGIARVPYGYKKVDGALVIEENQAEVVRRIFALYLSGTGAKAIAVQLNSDNIPSPTGNQWNITFPNRRTIEKPCSHADCLLI